VNLAHIRAVTFDVGGTLIEPYPSVGEIYAAVAAEFGFGSFPVEQLNRAFAGAWKQREDFDYSLAHWAKLVAATFGKAVPQGLFEAIYQRFKEPTTWRVHDEVPSILETLRQRGYRLGLVSNWDERLRDLLAALDLRKYFEVVVLSIEAGSTKPSPRIFEAALQALRVPAQEALHIGDSWEEDVEGARAAGMAAVLLDRKKSAAGSISSLRQLPPMLPVAPVTRKNSL